MVPAPQCFDRATRVEQHRERSEPILFRMQFLEGLQDGGGNVGATSHGFAENHVGDVLRRQVLQSRNQVVKPAAKATSGNFPHLTSVRTSEKRCVNEVVSLVIRYESHTTPLGSKSLGQVLQQSRLARPEKPAHEHQLSACIGSRGPGHLRTWWGRRGKNCHRNDRWSMFALCSGLSKGEMGEPCMETTAGDRTEKRPHDIDGEKTTTRARNRDTSPTGQIGNNSRPKVACRIESCLRQWREYANDHGEAKTDDDRHCPSGSPPRTTRLGSREDDECQHGCSHCFRQHGMPCAERGQFVSGIAKHSRVGKILAVDHGGKFAAGRAAHDSLA